MIRCETVERWLPWYASGRISTRKMQIMADHIAGCERCQKALAGIVQLRHRFSADASATPVPAQRVWEALTGRLPDRPRAQIDMGSFLIGLHVGFAGHNRRRPIQGDLRVLGHKVRIIGKRKKGA